MAALRESALNDSTAWRDYLSPANRTYYWNEAKNKSGVCVCVERDLLRV